MIKRVPNCSHRYLIATKIYHQKIIEAIKIICKQFYQWLQFTSGYYYIQAKMLKPWWQLQTQQTLKTIFYDPLQPILIFQSQWNDLLRSEIQIYRIKKQNLKFNFIKKIED